MAFMYLLIVKSTVSEFLVKCGTGSWCHNMQGKQNKFALMKKKKNKKKTL